MTKLLVHGAGDDAHHLPHVALLAVVAIRHADYSNATVLKSAHLQLAIHRIAR